MVWVTAPRTYRTRGLADRGPAIILLCPERDHRIDPRRAARRDDDARPRPRRARPRSARVSPGLPAEHRTAACDSACATRIDPAVPITTPAAASRNPSPTTSRKTSSSVAPSAILTPISARALRDRVRHHAVNPNCRQRDRDHREAERQHREEARLLNRIADHLRQAS